MSAVDTFQQQLVAHISNTTAITNLVASRVWHIYAKQGETLPYVVYSIVSGNDEQSHQGDLSMDSYRVQFDIYGGNSRVIGQIRDALKNALSGLSRKSTFGNGSVIIGHSVYDTEADFFEEAPEYYRKTVDITFTTNP